jgi:hypothetical protein
VKTWDRTYRASEVYESTEVTKVELDTFLRPDREGELKLARLLTRPRLSDDGKRNGFSLLDLFMIKAWDAVSCLGVHPRQVPKIAIEVATELSNFHSGARDDGEVRLVFVAFTNNGDGSVRLHITGCGIERARSAERVHRGRGNLIGALWIEVTPLWKGLRPRLAKLNEVAT